MKFTVTGRPEAAVAFGPGVVIVTTGGGGRSSLKIVALAVAVAASTAYASGGGGVPVTSVGRRVKVTVFAGSMSVSSMGTMGTSTNAAPAGIVIVAGGDV